MRVEAFAAETAGDDVVRSVRLSWVRLARLSPAPDRLPLYAARHPALDDVLLTTDPREAVALGYGRPALLVYLDACAPASGRLEVERPPLRWTHRWGQLGASRAGR